MRTLTASISLLSLMACDGDFGIRDEVPPPSTPAARPPEVVEQTDRITQVTTPEVDILFVIDNSCSMGDDQDALAQNFPTFMEFFEGSGLDYNIGAVSTDTDNSSSAGILQESDGLRYITPDVPDAVAVFDGMARLGSSGSAIERGLGAAYAALELNNDDPRNQGFFRPDAAIHSVYISDEDDQTPESLIGLNEWVRWYDGLKPELDQRSASSIVCFPVICGNIVPGTRYLNVTDQIGGVQYNIDDPNWQVVLERLGVQASGLKKEYFLSQTPVVDTIDVKVLRDTGGPQPTEIRFEPAVFDDSYDPPVLLSGEWTYEPTRNSITFQNFIPDPLDVIEVTYTLLSATQVPIEDEEEKQVDKK
ncbi:MAG: hypothetical protein AAGA48_17830 [Myxococcota bacterium]